MAKGQKLVEDFEREEYLHKEVWRVVQRQIDYAEANPTGALYDDLTVMVFAFHAIEGYLNYIGEKIAPDLWRHEKVQFSGSGIVGKLAAIFERCGLGAPDYGKSPYRTVSELRKLRDAVAHPRTRKTGDRLEYDDRNRPPLFAKSYLSKMVDHKRALRARNDVKIIADLIHAAARSKFADAGLGPDALDGITSMGTSSTRLSETA